MNEIEEIKSRIDIVELTGGYVQLKKGGRNYKGLCPFHSEKTPSFMVSGERQIWRCFGACNEGGDIFSFVQKVDGLSFGEAVRVLADKAGVKLSGKSYEKSEAKTKLYSANALAADFYQSLLEKEDGKKAKIYLTKDRGLTEKTIKDFSLGFSNSQKGALAEELRKHNFTVFDLEKAGLSAKKSGEYRDFFWGRLMFPIKDVTGQVIGFSARSLDPDGIPKYINTPDTEIYHKSEALYGIELAKEPIRKQDYAIIVEGMMDVIASHQAGVKNIVAPGGTALTENQLRLLGRFTKNLKLAFDIDFAGSEATRRAIEIAWEMGFNLKVITLTGGKDAGEVAIKNPKEWKEAVRGASYVVDYLFNSAFSKFDKKDAIGRKQIGKELLPVIRRIPDEIERETYVKKLAKELDIDEATILSAIQKISSPNEKFQEKAEPKKAARESFLEENLLGLITLFPNYLDFVESLLAPEDFAKENTSKIYKKMVEYYHKKQDFTESGFLASLGKEESEDLKHFVLSADASYEGLDEENKAEEIYFGAKRLKKISLEKKKKAISDEIEKLEGTGKKAEAKKALEKLQKLLDEEQKIS